MKMCGPCSFRLMGVLSNESSLFVALYLGFFEDNVLERFFVDSHSLQEGFGRDENLEDEVEIFQVSMEE
jgi:hypothetical protein